MEELKISCSSSSEYNSSVFEPSRISFAEDPPRPIFNFMEKRQNFHLVVDGMDMTPDNIVSTYYATIRDVFTHAAYENKPRSKSEPSLKASKSRMQSKSTTDSAVMKVYATTLNLDDIHIDHTIDTKESYTPEVGEIEPAPSAFYMSREYPLTSYPPKIFVILKETDTVYLFDLPSFSYDRGTTEGNAVEEENDYYQYITVGKGRNRKMVVEETQTRSTVTQTRHTLAVRPQKKNALCFASMWDMHDTYAQLAIKEEVEEKDDMVLYATAAEHLLRKRKKKKVTKGKTFEEISNTPEFLDAVLLTERVIGTREFGKAQKIYRGLVHMDPLSLDLIYIYSMRPLWSFESRETANRPISAVSFNPKNENILAVGYGKFVYAENFTGIVCVWCTKNPCVPERLYHFPESVTAVGFSEMNPNWLAVGFVNGDVYIIDITSYALKIIARSKRETNPCFDPIWVTAWYAMDRDTEYVLTACQDGRINRFVITKTHDYICTPMMRISTVEGKLKGLEVPKACLKVDVPITRYPAAMCTKWHPSIDHIYLVGTDEGCIHKCSTHYLNQHIDVFRAHAGPIYGVAFSPFWKALLATCGADSAVRLWMEGMDDVIMTLTCPSAVYGVAWCPINATVLVCVSGNILSVWDLRRKNHMPCAEYSFPGNVTLTYVSFSESGDNLIVADTAGRVHTFHLEDTPIPPYYQTKMLDEAIRKALCTRPQLLQQLDKLKRHSKSAS